MYSHLAILLRIIRNFLLVWIIFFLFSSSKFPWILILSWNKTIWWINKSLFSLVGKKSFVSTLLLFKKQEENFSFFGTKLDYNPEISGNENSVWLQSAIKWWFRLNFMIEIGKKCFNELCRPKKVQNKALKVGDSSFLLSKNRKNF